MNTKGALKKVIPAAKNEIIEQIDEEIRRYIASIEGNIFLPTTDFIKKRIEIYYSLSPNNLEKKCKKVAKIYLKNEREWMTKENIFCFLAYILIYNHNHTARDKSLLFEDTLELISNFLIVQILQ